MKKERKVVAVVLVALLVFLLGFGLGATKGIQIDINVEGGSTAAATAAVTQAATVAATEAPTTAATTAAPVTDAATDAAVADTAAATDAAVADTAATDAAVADTAAASDAAATSSAVPSTTDEIVAKYNEVVNAAKKLQNGTIHRTNDVTITVTDCSASLATSALNSVVQGLMGSDDNTYTFVNGVGTKEADGSSADANAVMAPSGKDAALQSAGVASATCTPSGDGYVMTITLVSETSTYDGTNTVNPVYHESVLVPLNLATIELPAGAKITNAEMTYPGATLTATVDGQGRLTKLETNLPMSGSGTGKLVVSLSVSLEGSMDDVFEITYN